MWGKEAVNSSREARISFALIPQISFTWSLSKFRMQDSRKSTPHPGRIPFSVLSNDVQISPYPSILYPVHCGLFICLSHDSKLSPLKVPAKISSKKFLIIYLPSARDRGAHHPRHGHVYVRGHLEECSHKEKVWVTTKTALWLLLWADT